MKKIKIINENRTANILIEDSSFEGVKLIGDTLAEDIMAVTDVCPKIISQISQCHEDNLIVVATIGKSEVLSEFERNKKVSTESINGKREVFMMQIVDRPFESADIEKAIVIIGSDKRGTIYGMFHLSELLGVSPLIYYGDVIPQKIENPEVVLDDVFISKEPSVEYRGFFINDEWPAFGNWATEKFGGINAKAYRKIFELLLRLKGNYMWPAMWNSSFSEDGPGIENAALADKLGVIMGTSHHEPLCRAGIEWQNKYRDYGDDSTWSFISNQKAITRFWEDGLRRNKDFENVITIGMRGEADSKLLPEDSTLKDNIDVIKKVVNVQKSLIKNIMPETFEKTPKMLAIYKEVEDYYFGDESCEGLKDWDELSDVIFLLSDDNHGNLRNLPTSEDRNHPGGYGMYYHFDYHGAPISYEWTNCNRLTKIWEQMTFAYEAGVKKMWIVNVGDLKEMEYPLCYFMELAYDYDKWKAPNKTEIFLKSWIDRQFGNSVTAEQKEKLFKVIEGYTRWNGARTPETMNENIYHPVNYQECDRVIEAVSDILSTANELNTELSGNALIAYRSMIYYAAAASLNLVIAWCETALNHEYAKRGYIYSNILAENIRKRIADDKRYIEEFHSFNNGKWNHCLSSAHTGFKTWDDRDWSYPVVYTVTPIAGAKAAVGFRGSNRFHLGAYWQDMKPLLNDDLINLECRYALLDLDSKGDIDFDYKITCDANWLLIENATGSISVKENERKTTRFMPRRELFSGKETARARVDIEFKNGQTTWVELEIIAEGSVGASINNQSKVHLERQEYICMRAEDFADKKDMKDGSFEVIDYLGREGSAVRVLPPAKAYKAWEKAPYLEYKVCVSEDDEYKLSMFLLTRNPSVKGQRIKFFVGTDGQKPEEVCAVSDHYYTEWQDVDWAQGVMNRTRIVTSDVKLKKGENSIYLYAGDPELVIEKLVLTKKGEELKKSYFGPTPFVI